MRKLRNTLWVIVGFFIGVYLLLLVLFNFGPLHQRINLWVTQSLSEYFQTEVSIGNIELRLFNQVNLSDVTIFDQSHQPLLRAKNISTRVSLSNFIHGRFYFRTISLLDANIDLYKNSQDAPLNCQFIIDRLSAEDEEEPSEKDFRINSIILRRCALKYDVLGVQKLPTLDANHLCFSDIDANISLKSLTDDNLKLRLRHLSFVEKSGLDVRHLSFILNGKESFAEISKFRLELPQSHVAFDRLHAKFNSNSLLKTLKTSLNLTDARISPADFFFIEPRLRGLTDSYDFSGYFVADSCRLSVSFFTLVGNHNDLSLDTDFFADFSTPNLRFDFNGLQLDARLDAPNFLKSLLGESEVYTYLQRNGRLSYQGDIKIYSDSLYYLKGVLETDLGRINHDFSYANDKANGDFIFDDVDLAKLLGKTVYEVPTNISGTLDVDFLLSENSQPVSGKWDLLLSKLHYQNETLEHVTSSGNLSRNHFVGNLVSHNSPLDISTDFDAGVFDNVLQSLNLYANCLSFAPKRLGLDFLSSQDVLSFDIDVDAPSVRSERLDLSSVISDLVLYKSDSLAAHVNNLQLNVKQLADGTHLTLDSDFLDARIDGPLSLKNVKDDVTRFFGMVWKDSEVLLSEKSASLSKSVSRNGAPWHISAHLSDISPIREFINIPIDVKGDMFLDGTVDLNGQYSSLTASMNELHVGKIPFVEPKVYFHGHQGAYSLFLQFDKEFSESLVKSELSVETSDESLLFDLKWKDRNSDAYAGQVKAVTRRDVDSSRDGQTVLRTVFEPTEILINDTVWSLSADRVLFNHDFVEIQNLNLSNSEQGVRVNGIFSKEHNDSLTAVLNGVDLTYLFDLLDFHPVDFSGFASGEAVLRISENSPQLYAHLDIDDFGINGGNLGRALIDGEYNVNKETVNLAAEIEDREKCHTSVAGGIFIGGKGLDLDIKSKGTNLAFLSPYFSGFFGRFGGRAYGHTRLFGLFKALQLEGENDITGQFYLPVTNTEYNVRSAHVKLIPNHMSFEDIELNDAHNGRASASGNVYHANLGKFVYDFNIDAEDMLIYDRRPSNGLPIDSRFFSSGNVKIKGKPGSLDLSMSLVPDGRTTFEYTVDTPQDYASQQLLRIRPVGLRAENEGVDTIMQAEIAPLDDFIPHGNTGTDVHLSLNFDMRDNVPLKVIMNAKTSDNIVVYGNGTLHATWYNKGTFQLFGTYNVERGEYKLRIQDVIHKNLQFSSGGKVYFNGRPFDGQLNLQASYPINSVSLSDLNFPSSIGSNTVKVNCLLNMSGTVSAPEVKFDLELPSAGEEVKQAVRRLVSTEEEMNQQIVYLLGVGRFYRYQSDYVSAQNNATPSGEAAAVNSFLSSTLSGQLNEFISDAVKSNNWRLGTNLSTGDYGWRDLEVEAMLSGRLLNDRLLINGNFGYRDRVEQPQNAGFVGDFDIQYLLTPNGTLRLKAYSQTNDRYFTKSTLTTQGIGVTVQRDFNNIRQLFTRTRRNKSKTNSEK